MLQKAIAMGVLLLSISTSYAGILSKEGKWYGYWGWNRAEYSNSDLHLTGSGYDFTLYDVEAVDKPSVTGFDPYFAPSRLTIPQTNGRIGYYLTDTLSISFGIDHMKYVMVQDQTVNIEGSIYTGQGFYGDYVAGDTQTLTTDFLKFEHTDGLNFISFEFEQYLPVWVADKGSAALSAYWGAGVAIMYPRTNTTLMGQDRYDQFNVAGYGMSVKVGAEMLFKNDFFMRLFVKTGQIDMDNVRTTSNSSDNLSHEFSFLETAIVFGLNF